MPQLWFAEHLRDKVLIILGDQIQHRLRHYRDGQRWGGNQIVQRKLLGGVERSEIHDFRDSKPEYGPKSNLIRAISFNSWASNEPILLSCWAIWTLHVMRGSWFVETGDRPPGLLDREMWTYLQNEDWCRKCSTVSRRTATIRQSRRIIHNKSKTIVVKCWGTTIIENDCLVATKKRSGAIEKRNRASA